MSRIGRKPIFFDSNIKIEFRIDSLIIEYKDIKKNFYIPNYINIKLRENELIFELLDTKYKNIYGLLRTLISNYIYSLTNTFSKEVSVEGVGYKFTINLNNLILHMGYSHPISLNIPKEIKIDTISPTKLKISSINKIILGDFCQKIKQFRPLEPYKGKGIRINNEFLKLKVGKRGK